MALVFGVASSNRVECGSGSSLDDLAAWTQIQWVYPTTLTSLRILSAKNDPLTPFGARVIRLNGTGGNLQVRVERATARTDYITSDTPLVTLSRWYCVAITYDINATKTTGIYVGDLSRPLTESAYGTATEGTGALLADAGGSFWIGNNSLLATSFQGRIGFHATYPRVLSLGDMKTIQQMFGLGASLQSPHVIPGSVIWMPLGIYNHTTPQIDCSGYGNHGVVTGATRVQDDYQLVRAPGYIFKRRIFIPSGVTSHDLVIQSASHSHTATNVVLTQVHSLTVANTSHAQTVENTVLTQLHVLSVQDTSHNHSAESLTLTQVHLLATQDSVHDHTSSNLVMEVIHHLIIQDSVHTHTVGSLSLTQIHELVIADTSHSHTADSPFVKPFLIVWLDPGGDAVQAVGYFNALTLGDIANTIFDTTQKVAGVGSWRFDSDTGVDTPIVAVAGVLGSARRISTYFRYDSVPDAAETVTEFVSSGIAYSGGGFDGVGNLIGGDDGVYATATPAQNAGQGSVLTLESSLDIPIGAVIDSVKIIYEYKVDTAASEAISRVKWMIDGVEGPDHDNTNEPLTDTVVTEDVTADRGWTWQDFDVVIFKVIVEARRGNTATAHTQSWDYVKVEVVYHLPTAIFAALNPTSTTTAFRIAITPKGTGAVLRFVDGAGESYDGITQLDIDTWPRISFSYIHHGTDDLDIKLYVNRIEELSITGASTNGVALDNLAHLHHGWVFSPGVDHRCWFDQLYIDDGDDLSDCGNKLSTYKGPASTNENDWNTTIGTGAVDERPLSITNGKQHTSVTGVRQTYTLQAASAGDIDLTGKTLVGYMGWAWAKLGAGDTDTALALIVNNVVQPVVSLGTTAALLKLLATTSAYPSHAAGVGMRSNDESADTFIYDLGAIVAYEGPAEDILLPFQLLAEDSLTPITDDLRAAPPTSYELCYRATDSSAVATITVSSLEQEDGALIQQAVIPLSGGSGRTRITPGIEVQVSVLVTGGDISLEIWHRMNFD